MRKIPFISLVCACWITAAAADTTVDASQAFAHSANTGWMSLKADTTHGVQLGLSFCSGYLWSANCGWIGFGNGPQNGWHYANNSATDWGVNHDGMGRLSGYAYGANIGWVTFEQSFGKPRVDLSTGLMSGAAWSPNIGWISFSNTNARIRMTRMETGPDMDDDGIGDAWEYRHAGNLTTLHGGSADADGDAVADSAEFYADTLPRDGHDQLRLTDLTQSTASNRVEWTAKSTRYYRLQQTESLGADANWTDCGTGLMPGSETGNMNRWVQASGAPNRFFRVKTLLPLSE